MNIDFSGKNNPNYKNGKTKCLDCHKQLTHYKKNARCRSCESKRRIQDPIIKEKGICKRGNFDIQRSDRIKTDNEVERTSYVLFKS
jgi:hypothetical protein